MTSGMIWKNTKALDFQRVYCNTQPPDPATYPTSLPHSLHQGPDHKESLMKRDTHNVPNFKLKIQCRAPQSSSTPVTTQGQCPLEAGPKATLSAQGPGISSEKSNHKFRGAKFEIMFQFSCYFHLIKKRIIDYNRNSVMLSLLTGLETCCKSKHNMCHESKLPRCLHEEEATLESLVFSH